ncbi:hypothetical protein CBOM_02395 [Ceraceosorus bombacis]|uniref:Uncharacterized protein n=1 Tax=Ceraceosorus bombacis TaxID=401625 RepID=A0A0P1BEM1_9BASI|nr:hypothetical protein CBOM_02395 [Ceraceosorus bombacis]
MRLANLSVAIPLIASLVWAQDIGGSGPKPPKVDNPSKLGPWKPPASSQGSPPASYTGMGRTLRVNSATDFCLLMPPDPTTQNLVDAEANAVAYCTQPSNDTRPMPDGFITSAHFRKAAGYVAVMGSFNAAVMNLGTNPADCGGEYDNHGAQGVGNPVGVGLPDGAHDFQQFMGSCDIPGKSTFVIRVCSGPRSYDLCDNKYDLMGALYTNPGPYEQDGFDNCDVTDDRALYDLGNGSTFRQGDQVTPLADAYPKPPPSSNCSPTASPAPSGATYTWNQAAAKQTPTANANGGSGSSGSTTGSDNGSGGSTTGSGTGSGTGNGSSSGADSATSRSYGRTPIYAGGSLALLSILVQCL